MVVVVVVMVGRCVVVVMVEVAMRQDGLRRRRWVAVGLCVVGWVGLGWLVVVVVVAGTSAMKNDGKDSLC